MPILNNEAIQQLRRDHQMLKMLVGRNESRLRLFQNELGEEGANASPAYTTVTIPARVGLTPGGPVTVTKLEVDPTSGDFIDGDQVEIYSWVKTDSADPTLEQDGKLYIWIEEDEVDRWWFTAQDCTKPAVSIEEGNLSANTAVSTTLLQLPGTALTLPTYEGIYNYNIYAEIEVLNIAGNQTWDLDIGLYDLTAAGWIKAWDWAGAGEPMTNPTFNNNFMVPVDASTAGHSVVLGAQRATTTGTVTLIALDGFGLAATGHEITGPL